MDPNLESRPNLARQTGQSATVLAVVSVFIYEPGGTA